MLPLVAIISIKKQIIPDWILPSVNEYLAGCQHEFTTASFLLNIHGWHT